MPTVPLEADLIASCRRLRLKREAGVKLHDLDLRQPIDQQRSVLFHRLRVLDLDWATPAESDVAGRGTFRETWQSSWRPELALAVIEAAVWGTTVPTAATAKLADAIDTGNLVALTAAVERALLAELPEGLRLLLEALAQRAALDADVVHLMDALPALARAHRYGDVRGTDTSALAAVASTMVVRICAGLAPAVLGLDPEAARQIEAATGPGAPRDRAVDRRAGNGGRDRPGPRARSAHQLARHPGGVARTGRCLDRDQRPLGPGAVRRRPHRRRSGPRAPCAVVRATAADKAAWVDGFFADGALLLIHDAELRALVDGWVAELSDSEFTDVLPLVRRTFSTFTPPERRLIGERLAAARSGRQAPRAVAAYDLELAAPALAVVDQIFGDRR